MDLGRIFWKLKDNTYRDALAFFGDLHLVWRNCQTFNLPGSLVYEASEKLSRMFQTWWNRTRVQLKMEDPKFEFAYRSPEPTGTMPGAEEGTRSRRLIIKKSFDDASSLLQSSPRNQTKSTGAKLKIKLTRGVKREHHSKGKGALVFPKSKDKPVDNETAACLEVCISILERLLHSSPAAVLEQASLQPTFVPSIPEICSSLVEARLRKWTRSPYSSSKNVLQEAGLYLRSQAVKNEHRKKIVQACQKLLKSMDELWIQAGFRQDVESLRNTADDQASESGKFAESNLRVTKARMEKMKRQEMEKEVKEAEDAIVALEKAKSDIEAAKAKLDKAKETLKESSRNWNAAYKGKLMHLSDLVKAKSQAQKQKDRALAAIKASQVATERLKEKEAALEVLKQEEERLLAARENEQSKLEVVPRDAVLVDVRHYSKKQKRKADTSESHLVDLGNFWLSMQP